MLNLNVLLYPLEDYIKCNVRYAILMEYCRKIDMSQQGPYAHPDTPWAMSLFTVIIDQESLNFDTMLNPNFDTMLFSENEARKYRVLPHVELLVVKTKREWL